jgi:hypothetical protein
MDFIQQNLIHLEGEIGMFVKWHLSHFHGPQEFPVPDLYWTSHSHFSLWWIHPKCLDIPFPFFSEDQGEEVDLPDQLPSCFNYIPGPVHSFYILSLFQFDLVCFKPWYAEIIMTFFFVTPLEGRYYVRTLNCPLSSLQFFVFEYFWNIFSVNMEDPTQSVFIAIYPAMVPEVATQLLMFCLHFLNSVLFQRCCLCLYK